MRILITGASGYVGEHLVHRLLLDNHELFGWNRSGAPAPDGMTMARVDLADGRKIIEAFQLTAPDVVIHLAALSGIDPVARDIERAEAVNVRATRIIAHQARNIGKPVRLLFASTDMVFDGEMAPYDENATPYPTTNYGRQKAAAERTIAAHDDSVVVRLALTYGPAISNRNAGFYEQQIGQLKSGEALPLFTDEIRSPVFVGDVAEAFATLVTHELTGTINMAGPESMSRFEMGERVAEALGLPLSALVETKRSAVESLEKRPRDLSMSTTRIPTELPQIPRRSIVEAIAPH